MKFGPWVRGATCVVWILISAAVAFAHVSVPAGTPTGVANQGARPYGVILGRTPAGQTKVLVRAKPAPTDTSLHIYMSFDEGLPTELDLKKTGGDFVAGPRPTANVGAIAPAGATTVHWVVTWDEDGVLVFAAEGTNNL